MESPGMSRLQSVWLSFNVKDSESVESFDPSLAFRNGVVRAEKLPAYCSTLMFAFRNNYTPLLQLDGLADHVLEFAQDQYGSRFIQQKLDSASPAVRKLVFDEMVAHINVLMLDVFGNYVIQKFFEIGTADQRAKLAAAIKGNVLKLALQMYGCRVLQTAFAFIDFDLQEGILKEMEGQILRCVKDQNGNHVVQKIIDSVEPQRWQFIIDAFVNSSPNTVLTLSTHTYGCRVIQRALEFAEEEQKRPLLDQLYKNIQVLVRDQYGNYVIQHIIEFGSPEDKDRIVDHIKDNAVKYAKHKFASNVLEKCLTFGLTAHKRGLILKLCGDREKSPLLELVKDPFANYVVQKMLEVADFTYRKKILTAIKPHLPALRKLSCGKFIIAKLSKYYPKKNIKSGPPSRSTPACVLCFLR